MTKGQKNVIEEDKILNIRSVKLFSVFEFLMVLALFSMEKYTHTVQETQQKLKRYLAKEIWSYGLKQRPRDVSVLVSSLYLRNLPFCDSLCPCSGFSKKPVLIQRMSNLTTGSFQLSYIRKLSLS